MAANIRWEHEAWWCDINESKQIIQDSLAVDSSLLLPCIQSAFHMLAESIGDYELLQHGDMTEEQRWARVKSQKHRGHASRKRKFGLHARPLPEVWQAARACTVGSLAELVRQALRKAWRADIANTYQSIMDVNAFSIDFLHRDCPAISIGQSLLDIQNVRRVCPPGVSREQANALGLVIAALSSTCMPISEQAVEGELPMGCTTHVRVAPGMPQRTRPTSDKQVYMRVQIAANVRDNAHRWVAWLRHGPPPQPQMHAVHLCNNKNCLNPYHIYWVRHG